METHSAFAPSLPLRPDPDATGELWDYFVQTRDSGAREKLLEAYMGFARMMAAKAFARRIYTQMEFADYMQYAVVGLMEALDRFEPQRGIRFETYAGSRITGAILTGIESSSEVQQQITARRRIVGKRVQSIMDDTPDQPAPDTVFVRLAEIAIGLAVGFALEHSGMHRDEHGQYADNTYTGVELRQLQARVLAAVNRLPENQRQVIESHYLQHKAFEEVASAMSLTRGRISQIHKQALGSLRALLHNSSEMDVRC